METYTFQQAKPVWAVGRQTEWNLHLGFRAFVEGKAQAKLCLACSTTYQLYVNNVYVTYGPARAAHGYYRVDEVDLSRYLREGRNTIAIMVASYNVGSYALLDQPGFLTAEIARDGAVLAATGVSGFDCLELKEFVQKVQRFSYQRAFGESMRLDAHTYDWRTGGDFTSIPLELCGEKAYLPRRVEFPCTEVAPATKIVSRGSHVPYRPEKFRRPWGLNVTTPGYKQYRDEELTERLSEEIQSMKYQLEDTEEVPASPQTLSAGRFAVYSLGRDYTGMIHFHAVCRKPTVFYVMFDEILRDGVVDPVRYSCVAAIKYQMQPGEYFPISFEPFTTQYINIVVAEGEMELSDLSMVQCVFPKIQKKLNTADPDLQLVYDAAVSTFRQNTLDIYMDCPCRERAGWLCDSFFTSRSEYCFTGKSTVEYNFLENFLLAEHVDNIPDGMFPMCYPSDFPATSYIPNWAMWLVLELEEYYGRTKDAGLVERFRKRIYQLKDFFKKYENEEGLLESLDAWVFVEWSKCNELVQDVNFPTNMLYASMLDAVSRLYDDKAAAEQAARLREKIRALSYNGSFFTDRMLRKDGKLIPGGEITETCQYYAFFTKTATPETYPQLWDTILYSFGPERQDKGLYPEIYPSNAFIGNYLRLDLLSQYGKEEQLLKESVGYFKFMAERTGTLWEKISDDASMNHGFASHAAVWLDKICNK